tara:strand:- start:166 stop:417 length:252 start_codon:yes stop_codon:yes gene_type:complete
MSNLKDKQRSELFEKIKSCLSSLEADTMLEPMVRTEVIFDVMEQIMARCISSTAIDRDNLNEILDKCTTNIKVSAKKFFEQNQ